MDAWKIIDRIAAIIGAIFTVIGAIYVVLGYYAASPSTPSPTTPNYAMTAPWWAYGLGGLGIILLLTAWFGLFLQRRGFHRQPFIFVNEPPRNIVAGKKFINERVPLDGIAYRDCTFTNVTFVYNGTGPVEISASHYKGIFIATNNPAVHGTIAALLGIGFIDKNIQIDAPPGFRVERPRNAP